MILAMIVINNQGKPRLAKFYNYTVPISISSLASSVKPNSGVCLHEIFDSIRFNLIFVFVGNLACGAATASNSQHLFRFFSNCFSIPHKFRFTVGTFFIFKLNEYRIEI
ncbi:putative Longin-like domain superfamily protein [Helianthus annuus]|nr:putative Longin-like domain superfamily protein [Helianthus annuus]